MSGASTPSWAPWKVLLKWQPFHIDALGLVTLLGAEEVNAAFGRLVSSKYLEYMPLLGAYVISGNRFTEKAAGFNLYNISRGIHTTDLGGWLTRWMLSQEFEHTSNFVKWTVTEPQSRKNQISFSLAISFTFNGFLVAGTILSKDWYGFANAMAMIVSIIVRAYVIGQQRDGLDVMVDKAVKEYEDEKTPDLRNRAPAAIPKEPQSDGSNCSSPPNGEKQATQNDKKTDAWTGTDTKVLIIQSDSKAVTFWMPNELLKPTSVFIAGPVILNPITYFIMRSVGWLAFAVHIVAIGMADLASQMYTVVLMVLPTILLIFKFGCDDSEWNFKGWVRRKIRGENANGKPDQQQDAEKSVKPTDFRLVRRCWIGSRLRADIYEWPESYEFHEEGEGSNKRWVSGVRKEGQKCSKKGQDLYAWLALTYDEEESMDKWDLFPHDRDGNITWWQAYKLKKGTLKGDKRNSMGPQQPLDSPPEDQQTRLFQMPRRTATDRILGGGALRGSSAFPALRDHESRSRQKTEQGPDASEAPTRRPQVTNQPPSTPPAGLDAAAGAATGAASSTSLDAPASSGALAQSRTTTGSPHDENHSETPHLSHDHSTE
ncbi:uncharacterized protein Z520_00345 [Fonsecaea multimorphosa CBS 102226]|uniref:Uncharacterized protein n=1 Tax=Fonsecaea multimorphosa CBS 102226 TaxID=1442371 RepID=A0A0D2L3N8_9EURO|nr:uncharacterized protein Z520_00345 [Fonsecaea multimorphosa CBS 102226]KIY03654.1 hypothetical protein Z520_00345 [Fonsecaea multimorphosa CBS 102226]OAL32353.1 hypothetical protein AYO22_00375 [Fonsecaea multimorphosa]